MYEYDVTVVVEENVPQYRVEVTAGDPIEAAVRAARIYRKLTDRDIYTVKYCNVKHPESRTELTGTLVIADVIETWLLHRPDYKEE